jgi:ABC-type antimicrobial peptide transport system permease subunit
MRGLISHLRYSIRLLLKSPGFTITTVLILALGIGANTAIFSLVNGVLLKPLPYPDPDRLVSIYQIFQGSKAQLDYPDYFDFRANQRAFDSLTAYYNDDVTLTGQGEPERIRGIYASGSLFKVLVISEHLWDSKFHRDPKVVGTNLLLNGRSFEIVGVSPAQANEWARVDVYLPLNQGPDFNEARQARAAFFLSGIGRLKKNVTLRQAQVDLETINKELSTQYPAVHSGVGIGLVLVRGYQALQNQPLGFQADHNLTADIYLPNSRYSNQTMCKAAWNSFAKEFFPGQDPIGKQLNNLGDKFGGKRSNFTMVGVAGDVEHHSPEIQLQRFQVYYPYTQDPWDPSPVSSATLALSVRGDPNAVLPDVRKAITSFDPDLPLSNIFTLDQLVEKGFANRRLSMLVVSLFSGAALLLAAVGLYAVVSYSVSQRKREFGIRVALGAQALNIIRLVVTQGLRIGGIGLLIGILSALVLAHFLQGALYRVQSTDPLTLLTAGVVLCLAAASACLLPALRATRVDLIKALRE